MSPFLINCLYVFWLFLPAYITNLLAVISAPKAGEEAWSIQFLNQPIDAGKSFRGKRILGDGNTWNGLLMAPAIGGWYFTICAVSGNVAGWGAYSSGQFFPLLTAPVMGYALAWGAMIGNMAGSFVKRRLGLAQGSSFPLVDQLDLAAGAFAVAWCAARILELSGYTKRNWLETFFHREDVLPLIVVTLTLQYGASLIGYLMGIKKKPW